ncbi:MAG: DUF5678 domain-containing protein [Candidatus Thermoplasmatota archaeon]|nr:DUF5678 domain-containing protein [Candidatus Thermoplasmatota archaeon]
MPKNRVNRKDENSNEFNYILTMENELGKYIEKWIAVVGEEIVAEGKTASEVYNKAKALHPNSVPLIMKVPVDQVMVL